jgi:hypothetical protein
MPVMAMKSESISEFLKVLDEIDGLLLALFFERQSFHEKGFACYARYRR